ncbi:caspase family protein [Streptomyces sp. NPDC001508]|uniref:caspase family protein n=1 Tax=Streptomyces sp. NPDC001508 TaxID=3154656 RepID=UPI003326B2B5
MPSPIGSRAVLIGVSHYRHFHDLPNVERNLTDLRRLLTSPRSWNLPEENCHVISDPADAQKVLGAVQEAAAQATEALLVYYAGHGQIDSDEEEFFLTHKDSRPHTVWAGIEYKHLRREIQKSRARLRIVVLDCCYAGRATMRGEEIDLAEKATAEGTCVLAASSKEALSEPDQPNTAFTGELLNILTHGVPDGPPLLDANTVFQVARRNLIQHGKPQPSMNAGNTAGTVPLAHNAQCPSSADPPPQPQPEQARNTPAEPADDTVRFTKRYGCLTALLPLLAGMLVLAAWGSAVDDPLLVYKVFTSDTPDEDPRLGMAAYGFLSALGVGWLGYRRLFSPYELHISAEGVQVRRGSGGRVARYGWHRVLKATVEWVPQRRYGHGRFFLILQLRDRTPPQLPRSARRAGRRWKLDGSCVADLGRLHCAPHDVDQALERFAPRGLWAQTPAAQRAGYTAPAPAPAPVPAATLQGATRRMRLGVLALALTALALIPSLTIAVTIPAHRYGWAFVPLSLWTLFLLVPVLIPALLLRHRAGLTIGADGITHQSRSGTRRWSWDQIDHVGIMSWRRDTPATGALFLKPRDLPSSRPRAGVHTLLAPIEARLGGVLVCDLISMGISRREIETTILRHAGDIWDPDPRPQYGVIQDDTERAHYEGDFLGLGTWAALIGAVAASAVLSGIAMDPVLHHRSAAHWLTAVMDYTLVLAFCLPFITLRTPLTLQIDNRAFTLSSRSRRMTIPWGHIHTIERIPSASGKGRPDDLVIWLRPEDAFRYRGFWRLGAHLTGARLRIVGLHQKGALRISPERLDVALQRFAPERFHSSPRTVQTTHHPTDQGRAEERPTRLP